jgi:hypothetical protein
VTLTVDICKDVHAISPLVYGLKRSWFARSGCANRCPTRLRAPLDMVCCIGLGIVVD